MQDVCLHVDTLIMTCLDFFLQFVLIKLFLSHQIILPCVKYISCTFINTRVKVNLKVPFTICQNCNNSMILYVDFAKSYSVHVLKPLLALVLSLSTVLPFGLIDDL